MGFERYMDGRYEESGGGRRGNRVSSSIGKREETEERKGAVESEREHRVVENTERYSLVGIVCCLVYHDPPDFSGGVSLV